MAPTADGEEISEAITSTSIGVGRAPRKTLEPAGRSKPGTGRHTDAAAIDARVNGIIPHHQASGAKPGHNRRDA